MLKSITLTNFRRHEALTVDFDKGLNAVRAANEAGKSTIYEAVTYGFFGAKGLKESLAETVTYGKAETALKVELLFMVNQSDYLIKRSKAGATLHHTDGTVTGQTEVTKFVENLLGCSADTASKLMLANQDALRGALSEGPTAASKLIEVLANFDLIDTLLELAQTHLPSGNLSVVESRIASLVTQAVEPQAFDLAPLKAEAKAAEIQFGIAEAARITAKFAMDDINCEAATTELQMWEISNSNAIRLEADLLALEQALTTPLPIAVDEQKIVDLTTQVAAKKVEKNALAQYAIFQQAPYPPAWEGDVASLLEELKKADAVWTLASKELSNLELEKRSLEAKLVKELTCAFCQKDLKDVPEVAQVNNALTVKIELIDEKIVDQTAHLITAQEYLQELRAIQRDHYQAEKIYAHMGENVRLDPGTVPHTATWVGPTKANKTDFAAELVVLESQKKEHTRAVAVHEMNLKRRANVSKELSDTQTRRKDFNREAALEKLRLFKERKVTYELALEARNLAQGTLDNAKHALQNQQIIQVETEKRITAARMALVAAQSEMQDMAKNNVLIKKLRNARPQIADKLWSLVLASVSHYFSQIRGTASVVTRSDSGFKVNGQSVTGLSGSTIDSLGLAIRVALVKTFLPNVRFLMLDEPGKGCDQNRESAMIGTVAACDFDQVLLVTHSELADSFAQKVVTLGAST